MTAREHSLREQVITEATKWLGTPFEHQAMVKGAGVGCGTLLIGVYGQCGIAVPKVEALGHFAHDWHLHTTEERYLTIVKTFAVEVEKPTSGDIVLFRYGRVFAHSGIVLRWPLVIHVMWNRHVELGNADLAPLGPRRTAKFLSPFGMVKS